MIDSLINFTDGDMQKLTLDPPVEPEAPPEAPEAPVLEEKIYDQSLAQWYINLWYAMDASDNSDLLYTVYPENESPYKTVPNMDKQTTLKNINYVVMDEDKAYDSEWLQNSLAKGMITVSQVRESDTVSDITWNAMEYSNITELVETEDTEKIAKAEAEYQEISVEIQAKDKEFDIGGEQKAIQDLKNGVYYIKLLVSIVGEDNKIIPLGNYKIQEKMLNNRPMLVFYQGHQEIGMLKLKLFEDNLKKENDLVYSRVDIVSDELVRIVYSTLSDTKCALARVYLQN